MTVGSLEDAKKIGKTLVEQNLVACVNLLENMISIYKWEEQLKEDQEVPATTWLYMPLSNK